MRRKTFREVEKHLKTGGNVEIHAITFGVDVEKPSRPSKNTSKAGLVSKNLRG
jgi:hypothetical protein